MFKYFLIAGLGVGVAASLASGISQRAHTTRNDQTYEVETNPLSREGSAKATVRLYNRDDGYRGRTVMITESKDAGTGHLRRQVYGEDVSRNGHWTNIHVCFGRDVCVYGLTENSPSYMTHGLYDEAVVRLNHAAADATTRGRRTR